MFKHRSRCADTSQAVVNNSLYACYSQWPSFLVHLFVKYW